MCKRVLQRDFVSYSSALAKSPDNCWSAVSLMALLESPLTSFPVPVDHYRPTACYYF